MVKLIAIAVSCSGPLLITIAHALQAGALPSAHEDLFERMLIAQSQLKNLTLVTCDSHSSHYDVAFAIDPQGLL